MSPNLTPGNAKHDIVFKDARYIEGKEYMRCPYCNFYGSRVTDTRAATVADQPVGIGRTRKCDQCGGKWRTVEMKLETLNEWQ